MATWRGALLMATAAYVAYGRQQREAGHHDLLHFASRIKIGESRDNVLAALTSGEGRVQSMRLTGFGDFDFIYAY